MATESSTVDAATASFSNIAAQRHTLRTFVACIGDAHAPSRARAAAALAICETVVDVGCGPAVGLDSARAAAIAQRLPVPLYIGVDPVVAMLAESRAHREGVRILTNTPGQTPRATIVADALATPRHEWADRDMPPVVLVHDEPLRQLRHVPELAADGVLVRHVLEHLREPWALLDHCARIARRRLVVVLSQESRGPAIAHDRGGVSTRPLLTDAHLGAQRWSHYRPHLLERAAVHGLTCREQLRGVPDGLVVREELLCFERTGSPS